MTDLSLREFERRWDETGSPEDEARYFRERLRAGTLTESQLELAAYCGHSAARLAMGDGTPSPPRSLEELNAGLAKWGDAWMVRAAIAAARYALPFFERLEPNDRRCANAVSAASAWCESPSPDAADRARQAFQQAADAANALKTKQFLFALPPRTSYLDGRLAFCGAWSTAYAAGAAAGGIAPGRTATEEARVAILRAAASLGSEAGLPTGDSEAVRTAIEADLIKAALDSAAGH